MGSVPTQGMQYSAAPAITPQYQQQPPPQMGMGQHQPQQHGSYSDQHYQQQQNSRNKSSRRTTASISELPFSVQGFLQNLQATRQIDGPLDDGMLGMVKDLPEHLAIQSLQKFASVEKSTVRNKTPYLAGVLRRELERINRR